MRIALVRHGPTLWNVQGRIQGKTDIALSDDGAAQMARLRLPRNFSYARAFVSPLRRARQTAALLGIENPVIDARLAEHDWGVWEGLTRDEILARDGLDALSHAGLDLHPPGGESTRDFIARVTAFLRDAAAGEGDAVAVTHRGVLRAAYVIATGWNMATPMPPELDLSKMLVLDGTLAIATLNVPLEAR